MASRFPRSGILAALWIPTDDRGRLKRRALAQHLAWLRLKGVQGVLALGSTGEFPYFELKQKQALLEQIAELAAPLPVIAHLTDIRPGAVAELGRFARRLDLAGVAVMPPSFYKVSQADLLAFLLRAAEAAQLPVLLYNFPELVGNRIGLETIAAFAQRAPMAGIKQSGTEFGYHKPLIALGRQKGFSVFSGADTRLPEVLALGAVGCIGGMVNFVPEPMVGIFDAWNQGRRGETAAPAKALMEVGAIIDQLTFPLNVAAAMEARGLDPGVPKAIVSQPSAALYRRMLPKLRSLYRKMGLAPVGQHRQSG
jgi:4-hydroxy-tetrahydrodipicolinate synthase